MNKSFPADVPGGGVEGSEKSKTPVLIHPPCGRECKKRKEKPCQNRDGESEGRKGRKEGN